MDSDFSDFTNAKDISDVEIKKSADPAEKKRAYLHQTGSSTIHKVGDVEVECVYGGQKLEKMLSDLISG